MNHDLMFTYEKCEKLLKIVENQRYTDIFSDFEIQFCEGKEFDESRLEKVEPGFRWGGYNQYGWLRIHVRFPEKYKGNVIAGLFDFGRTGLGGNSGFEALCYLDDEKYQGVDQNHGEVILPKDLSQCTLKFQLWAGLDGGGNEREISLRHEIRQCEFALLDKRVDDFYYLFKALLQTLKQMEKNQSYYQLMDLADQVYKSIGLTNQETMIQDIYSAYTFLENELEKLRENPETIVRCLGHTHIDIAWLWTLDHSREKAQRSFSTVMRLMEQYPQYIFFQSQPHIYAKLMEDAPDLYEQIKTKVQEGAWEPNGGMWVEADCLLTSGESLARQFLYGKKFFSKEFGVESDILWLPDVFGYSAALPQILKLADIDYFMTTKISWNQYNRMPNDTFSWRGIDGTEVLTHFVSTPYVEDWEELNNLSFYTYNGLMNANTVNGIWKGYSNKGFTDELLVSYGYGDGGGGVTRDMLEMVDKLDKIPTNPKIITGKASEYFKKLENLNHETPLNVWDGELYLEFHRGTYTSQSRTKKYNRQLEYELCNNEILSIAANPKNYPSKLYESLWKEVLSRQFHDILPGSSITEVYEEAEKTYAEIADTLRTNTDQIVEGMIEKREGFSLFNPISQHNRQQVFIETGALGEFHTLDQGTKLEAQWSEPKKGYYVEVDLKPMAFTNIGFSEDQNKQDGKTESNETLQVENDSYKIQWNSTGKIVSLFDKDGNKELIPENRYYNVLAIFEDSPRQFDAWELEPYYDEKKQEVENLVSSKLIEDGPLTKIVEFCWEFNDSKITQNLILRSSTKRIDFETTVDWNERDSILRTYFETDIRKTRATFDIQFGHIERTTHDNTVWDFAKFEVAAQKWADLSQRGKGLAVLNNCKYGYSVKGSTIGLSLLKSASVPDKTADLGIHDFTYSILPHSGDFYDDDVELEALVLNNPAKYFSGQVSNTDSLFILDQKNVLIDAVKLSESKDSVIVRLHEYAGMNTGVKITSSLKFKEWREVNLLERELTKFTGSDIDLKFKPFEIKSLELQL